MTETMLSIVRTSGRVVAQAPAKLNLFLEVTGRRDDGFHNLKTLMVPIDWYDQVALEAGTTRDQLVVQGSDLSAGPSNLVLRALARLRLRCDFPPVSASLWKSIPEGSGLGGGSADAAATLVAADHLFSLDLEFQVLTEVAAELGSDVPFFLGSGPALCTGRGEILEPCGHGLFGGERPWFLIVAPELHSSTADVFARLAFPLTSPDGETSFQRSNFTSGHWRRHLFNRLERPARQTPGLENVARYVEQFSADSRAWGMTGSGSAFYLVCDHEDSARKWATQVEGDFAQGCFPAGEPMPASGRVGVTTRVVRLHPVGHRRP